MIRLLSSALMWALGLFAFFGEAFLTVPQVTLPPDTYEACIVFDPDSCICDHDTPLLAMDTLKYLHEHPWFKRQHDMGVGRFFITAKSLMNQ